MAATLFQNATLVDTQADEAHEDGHLLVEDARIKEISHKPIKISGDNVQILDLAGKTLMPGLIDAHVHVKAANLDLSLLARKPSSYVFAETARIMEAMLMRGFTTVRDAAGADRGLADAVDHGLLTGPRLRVCGLALSQTGGHSDTRPVTAMSEPGDVEAYNRIQHFGRIADGVAE